MTIGLYRSPRTGLGVNSAFPSWISDLNQIIRTLSPQASYTSILFQSGHTGRIALGQEWLPQGQIFCLSLGQACFINGSLIRGSSRGPNYITTNFQQPIDIILDTDPCLLMLVGTLQNIQPQMIACLEQLQACNFPVQQQKYEILQQILADNRATPDFQQTRAEEIFMQQANARAKSHREGFRTFALGGEEHPDLPPPLLLVSR